MSVRYVLVQVRAGVVRLTKLYTCFCVRLPIDQASGWSSCRPRVELRDRGPDVEIERCGRLGPGEVLMVECRGIRSGQLALFVAELQAAIELGCVGLERP